MKKRLTTATLLLISALAATGCDGSKVTLKESDGNSIIFSIDVDGENYKYCANQLLSDLQDDEHAKNELYQEVSRKVFTQYAEANLEDKKISSIKADAADKIDDFKDECKSAAKESGTDYDSYLEAELEENGVITLDELKDLYYYQGLKSKVFDDYVEETSHYNYFLDKYLNAYTPFQVKHILVAANSADTNFKDGTMSASNARKVVSVLNRFLNGDTFESIAEITDDTSSADNGGLMPFNEAQNYVHEFRFATYAQEIFANHSTAQERYDVAAALHLIDKEDTTQEEFVESELYQVYQNGIETVSLTAILGLNKNITSSVKGWFNFFDYDETTTTYTQKEGVSLKTVADQAYDVGKYEKGDDNYYEEYELERNVIFNKYLNTHKVKYIEVDGDYTTNDKVHTTSFGGKTILADQNGNPVFFALASTGIHFMSIAWNSFNPLGNGYTSQAISSEALDSYAKIVSAQEGTTVAAADLTREQINHAYFTLFDDKATDYSAYQYTYIGRNGNYTSKTKLSSASEGLLDDITNYVSSLEYYVFDALVYNTESSLETSKFQVQFYEDSLGDIIKDYVQDKLDTIDKSFADSVSTEIKTYADKLAREEEVKTAAKIW